MKCLLAKVTDKIIYGTVDTPFWSFSITMCFTCSLALDTEVNEILCEQ